MLLNSWVNICLVPFFLFWYCCECTHSTSLAATTSNRTLSERVVCGTSPIAVCAQHHSALCLVRLNVPWEDSHVYCYYDFTGYFIANIAISCVIWNGSTEGMSAFAIWPHRTNRERTSQTRCVMADEVLCHLIRFMSSFRLTWIRRLCCVCVCGEYVYEYIIWNHPMNRWADIIASLFCIHRAVF